MGMRSFGPGLTHVRVRTTKSLRDAYYAHPVSIVVVVGSYRRTSFTSTSIRRAHAGS